MAEIHEESLERESLRIWLERRIPRMPPSFLASFPNLEKKIGGDPSGLAEAGTRAIEDALATPGRNRGAAFHLLAGDALLTYACEAAAEDKVPGSSLQSLLTQIGDSFR